MKAINRQKYYIILTLIMIIIFHPISYALTAEDNGLNIKAQESITKVPTPRENFAQGNNVKEIIYDNAIKQNMDPDYLLGICLIETGGTLNPKLVGPKTYCGRASGVMQLMPVIIKIYNIEDPLDPKENIEAGSTHLKYLIDYYKDKKVYDENENLIKTEYVAAMAYNWGQGNVDGMLKNYDCIIIKRLPHEVRRYLRIIIAHCRGDNEGVKKLLE